MSEVQLQNALNEVFRALGAVAMRLESMEEQLSRHFEDEKQQNKKLEDLTDFMKAERERKRLIRRACGAILTGAGAAVGILVQLFPDSIRHIWPFHLPQ